MVPAEVHVIAAMPYKGPGKIDRELLRMRAIAAALIEQVPFFENASSDFLRDVIPRLDARQFVPGEIVVYEGDVGRGKGTQLFSLRRKGCRKELRPLSFPSLAIYVVRLHQAFVSQPGFDHVCHLAGLVLEFFEAFLVAIGVGPTGEREEILRLVSPGFEPVGPR